jgi:CRP-like cAMP-binding protein
VRSFAADEDIVREGDRPSESSLLLEGISCRYRLLSNGRRQITALHVPGDFVDLHSFLLKTMDHGVSAITPCRYALVPHEALRVITEKHPHLTRMLWLLTLIDAAIHREWITGMGRRSALGQAAHLLCELFRRLEAVGLTEGNTFRFPLSQSEIGDTLGLSAVHVNRVIQELRSGGLVNWRGDLVTIEDFDRLADVAEFDPTYLHLNREAR